MNRKQKSIKSLSPDEEFDKFRYNTDEEYKKLWLDKRIDIITLCYWIIMFFIINI